MQKGYILQKTVAIIVLIYVKLKEILIQKLFITKRNNRKMRILLKLSRIQAVLHIYIYYFIIKIIAAYTTSFSRAHANNIFL